MSPPAPGSELPSGFHLLLDPSVRSFAGGTILVGGHPGRILKLAPGGPSALAALTGGGPLTGGQRQLGRRLVEAGMAHPVPPPEGSGMVADVTVVIPVRDRSELLDQCLSSLGRHTAALVVDDGSQDPGPVAEVCRRHGARLVVRTVNGGPAAARNAGLAQVDSELVAFLDSDCVVPAGWLGPLVRMFDDPAVGAVAPRIRPFGSSGSPRDRFNRGRSPLDMGPQPSPVGPDRRVRYVPTAALVARRVAVTDGFDPGLRFGEDVDLVWSLVDAGWEVRYLPSVEVEHHAPATWAGLLGRRFRYGTSAGPLARRHPGRLAPVKLRPWPAVAALALLAGRPRTSALVTAFYGVHLARRVRRLDIPPSLAVGWSAQGTAWTLFGLGRAATVVAGPALVALGLGRGKPGRRVRRAAVTLAALPPLVEWWQRRPDLDPLRWSVASIVDDVAYGLGVWSGCVRARMLSPLLPSLQMDGRDPDPAVGS
ncbi:MAG TPA: mycofactocin biosynthesis glycosyltransferase MftF [Acidimicrobiales bacterium]|nr:mycofactocin biosynthesis glycosyltransferase MftF [Acidimicrobiales bacterium]